MYKIFNNNLLNVLINLINILYFIIVINSIMDNNNEMKNDSTLIIIIIIIVLVCIFTIFSVYFFSKSESNKVPIESDNTNIDLTSSSSLSFVGKTTPTPISQQNVTTELSSTSINAMVIVPTPAPTEKPLGTKGLKQIDCVVDETGMFCSHPLEYDLSRYEKKKIKLIDGPIFKISFSEERQGTANEWRIEKDYYIIFPLILTDFIISLAEKSIKINSVEDFISEINKLDKLYEKQNRIPDKCLKVPLTTRNESKPPYNTICAFFPGFTTIQNLISTMERSLVPFISKNVLTDYYNMIDKKILSEKIPSLTLFEFIMYVASMNEIHNSEFSYLTLCNNYKSVPGINC